MKEINNYIVNLETLLLIPVDNNRTKIFEMEDEFIVKKNIMEIIKVGVYFFEGLLKEGKRTQTKGMPKKGQSLQKRNRRHMSG